MGKKIKVSDLISLQEIKKHSKIKREFIVLKVENPSDGRVFSAGDSDVEIALSREGAEKLGVALLSLMEKDLLKELRRRAAPVNKKLLKSASKIAKKAYEQSIKE